MYRFVHCTDGKWFCGPECKSASSSKKKKIVSKKSVKDTDDKDYLQAYCMALLWRGLNDRVRHMAVRFGNGLKVVQYWRHDMVEFFARNHTKYFLLGHRLLAGMTNNCVIHSFNLG
jgi:hypothetical protein